MNKKSFFQSFTILFALLLLVSCREERAIDRILEEFHNAQSDYVMVAAHRAGHNGYVENSIPAIEHAINIGVDIIELDVKVTTDSVVILNHDRTIDRTTTGTGDPESYSWAELQKFRLKMPDGTVTDLQLATFEEALNRVKGKAMIDIDLKTSNLKPVFDVLQKTGTLNQIIFFDSDFEILKEVQAHFPTANVMPRARSFGMADTALMIFDAPVVHIDDSFYTNELTLLIKGKNARIWINALGDQDRLINAGESDQALANLLDKGANIIQTDEPEKLIPLLEARGRRK
ncbi:glycerophosphodiester phosphodiesterase family protein [Maribellus sp. CM-23]|uniref:glycerophosphodiester phosphodiesterase family protein n=1 Tax=Maribellus sp. CM-23 TaxID=2781026 RepID=UPI001F401C5C|nr:glycerophosphodiester phosphodiesterase family protein [Maribellus sp. CM-23]MCE4562798.1 glycerophosphodiester phosphodiesterase family protein [Maribellus sp. CM-23]